MFKVFHTDSYDYELKKWSKKDFETANKLSKQLSINPYSGKPLSFPFLREKKVRGKRIYFLLYEDLKLILLIATSKKKNQNKTINHIKKHLSNYRIYAERFKRLF